MLLEQASRVDPFPPSQARVSAGRHERPHSHLIVLLGQPQTATWVHMYIAFVANPSNVAKKRCSSECILDQKLKLCFKLYFS
jgi:hypothetical protein